MGVGVTVGVGVEVGSGGGVGVRVGGIGVSVAVGIGVDVGEGVGVGTGVAVGVGVGVWVGWGVAVGVGTARVGSGVLVGGGGVGSGDVHATVNRSPAHAYASMAHQSERREATAARRTMGRVRVGNITLKHISDASPPSQRDSRACYTQPAPEQTGDHSVPRRQAVGRLSASLENAWRSS